MARDILEIGSSPANERCAQVGEAHYMVQARQECAAFINQIKRQFGKPPENVAIYTKANAHEFGTYYEVVISYADNDEEGMDWAFRVEKEVAANWDDEAKKELGIR